jgi:hypothetical protein
MNRIGITLAIAAGVVSATAVAGPGVTGTSSIFRPADLGVTGTSGIMRANSAGVTGTSGIKANSAGVTGTSGIKANSAGVTGTSGVGRVTLDGSSSGVSDAAANEIAVATETIATEERCTSSGQTGC